jgi:hypothetical protein
MLVITNQKSLFIVSESGLSRSRSAENQTDIFSLDAFSGAAVHRKDSLLRHLVLDDTEQSLLHLTCELSAQNDCGALGNVQSNAGLRFWL